MNDPRGAAQMAYRMNLYPHEEPPIATNAKTIDDGARSNNKIGISPPIFIQISPLNNPPRRNDELDTAVLLVWWLLTIKSTPKDAARTG